jgi:hypothetical protein
MAANPNVGSDAQAGAGSQPDQPVSPQAQPPIESEATKLLAVLESKLDGRFKSLEDNLTGLKKVQGEIDRSRNAFQEQLAKLSQYEKQGMTRDEAVVAMQNDDATESRWTNLEKKLDTLADQLATGGTQASGQQKVAEVFAKIGLDVKDPRVASSLLKQFKDADAVELEAYRLLRSIQQSPNPNPAQNASLNGNAPAGGMNAQQIEEKSTQLLRLFDNYTQNEPQIKVLQKEIEEYWATHK